jgi:hypothetical protein
MLPRLRERLTLVLLALLPFHALGVTLLTRVVAGPNQAPMGALALWKEALLAVVLLLALIEIVRSGDLKKALKLDRFDTCILVLAAALAVTSFLAGTPLAQIAYGIRYDLVPLAAFVILRRVPWGDAFLARLPFVLGGAVLAAVVYGLLTLAMPASFFTALGYSDLHSLYIPSGPVAPFQQIGGTALRRLQGAMSGPNQFGIWLAALLPVVLALGGRWRRFVAPLALLAILLSFSRAAWIAAAAVMLVSFWPALRKLSVTAVTVLCVGILALSAAVLAFFPSVILRLESSADHLRNPIEALGIMVSEPLGRGLGSAGPAHNRVSDACVLLEATRRGQRRTPTSACSSAASRCNPPAKNVPVRCFRKTGTCSSASKADGSRCSRSWRWSFCSSVDYGPRLRQWASWPWRSRGCSCTHGKMPPWRTQRGFSRRLRSRSGPRSVNACSSVS